MSSLLKDDTKAEGFRNEGNSLYKQRKFYESLICYNKSLCFSTLSSPQKALAFANRSAVYLELKLFDHCLENIKLARDHNYSSGERINEREMKCNELKKQHREDPVNGPSYFSKLSYPRNKKIPFIAECLELHHNKKYGNHLITNRVLDPGNIIAIEEPFLPAVTFKGRFSKCVNCLSTNMLNFIPCERCSNGKNQ